MVDEADDNLENSEDEDEYPDQDTGSGGANDYSNHWFYFKKNYIETTN